MIKFLMRAYREKPLTDEEKKAILDLLTQLGFVNILTEEHNEGELIEDEY